MPTGIKGVFIRNRLFFFELRHEIIGKKSLPANWEQRNFLQGQGGAEEE